MNQTQMVLPFLQTLEDLGDSAEPKDVYAALADRLAIPQSEREARNEDGVPVWPRHVRWVRQRAKAKGLVAGEPGTWVLTGKGKRVLHEALPGLAVTVFTTPAGVAVWGLVESALGLIDDRSVNLVLTSPEFALVAAKEYGNRPEREWLDWMVELVRTLLPKLTPDGSLFIDLGQAYRPGEPALSGYQHRLWVRLVDELGLHPNHEITWVNKAALPAPAAWVTVRRLRLKGAVNTLYGFGLTPWAKSDNRRVLVPYSDAMKKVLQRGWKEQERPSGHVLTGFDRDNGGAIPPNYLEVANTASNDVYSRRCREEGLPIHPARMAQAVAELVIKLVTEPGDLVLDPFGGSGTTAAAAEKLGRRWIVTDKMLEYLLGGRHRFPKAYVQDRSLLRLALEGRVA